MGSASRRVAAGLLLASLLTGCVSFGGGSELSEEDRAALEGLYDDPLFEEAPPGAGELLGEDFQTECGEEGADPIGGRTWVLLDDGQDAVAFYRDLGRDNGWEVVEESPPDPGAQFGSRTASLVMERASEGYTYSFSVLIGRSNLHDDVEIGAHASIDEPAIC